MFDLCEIVEQIYQELGCGFTESVYQRALEVALQRTGYHCRLEVPYLVHFQGVPVGMVRLDMVVNDEVIIELKRVPCIMKKHKNQLQKYLNVTGLLRGYLINFPEDGNPQIYSEEKSSSSNSY